MLWRIGDPAVMVCLVDTYLDRAQLQLCKEHKEVWSRN
ncbi:hypothetical protein EJB05_27827, partial [Eragrostis curvula]